MCYNVNYQGDFMKNFTSARPAAKFGCHSAANRHFGAQNSAVGRFGQIAHVAHITKVFGGEAAFSGADKFLFR
jgi:hypothetical protein